jgi:hypothetical protein
MSQAVQAPTRSDADVADGMVTVGGVAEVAVRAVVGIAGVQALIYAVREHPVLCLLFATGIGFFVGSDRRARALRNGKATAR